MSDKEKDSEKKIRELASEIVNELLKSNKAASIDLGGKFIDVDISTGGTAEKCGPKFGSCEDYKCQSNFKCQYSLGFNCGKNFTCSGRYTDVNAPKP